LTALKVERGDEFAEEESGHGGGLDYRLVAQADCQFVLVTQLEHRRDLPAEQIRTADTSSQKTKTE
jgi:hypothetical protein